MGSKNDSFVRHADVIKDVREYGIPSNNLLFNLLGAEPSGVYIDVNAEVLREFVKNDLAGFGVDVNLKDITFERDNNGKNSFKILIWLDKNSKYINYSDPDKNSIYSGKTNYYMSEDLVKVVNAYVEDRGAKNFYNATNDSKKVALALDEELFLATAFDSENIAFKECIKYNEVKDNDDAPIIYGKMLTIHTKWDKNGDLVAIRMVITKPDDGSGIKLEPGKAIKIL